MVDWGALLTVQLVSIGATLAVVVLVSLAVVGLSAPATHRAGLSTPSARTGVVIGVTCVVLAASIVLFGLWEIVAR
jgi:hypothetical protein